MQEASHTPRPGESHFGRLDFRHPDGSLTPAGTMFITLDPLEVAEAHAILRDLLSRGSVEANDDWYKDATVILLDIIANMIGFEE